MQTNEIIRQHPNNIHKATEAFTMTENSEKICKATTIYLSPVIQCSISKPVIDDGVKKLRFWGKDGQQVLVKHGKTYDRCNPC